VRFSFRSNKLSSAGQLRLVSPGQFSAFLLLGIIPEEERMTPELWIGWGFSGLGALCFALEILVTSSTVIMGGIGVVLCLMGRIKFAETSIEPTPFGCAGQVTIRLEFTHFRLFRKHRCVVTLRESADDSKETERETWYAKHHR
jgi:hypothetical protein